MTFAQGEQAELEGMLDRLRHAIHSPSPRARRDIDYEWRSAMPEGLRRELDNLPSASLLRLEPAKSLPSVQLSTSPNEKCRTHTVHAPPSVVSGVFLGTKCPIVDVSEHDQQHLHQFFNPTSQRPVVLKGFGRCLLDPSTPWTLNNLERLCGQQLVEGVRVARPGSTTFDYADEGKNLCFSDSSAEGQLEPMLFADFVARLRASNRSPYYLWAVLLAAKADQDNLVRSPLAELLWQEGLGAFKWDELEPLRELGDLGRVKNMQLFCSGAAAVTACHYDQSQNLFLQLDGMKRFVLFPPMVGASSFLPFPISHPRDRCARARLDEGAPSQDGPFVSSSRYPCAALARGQGIEAVLEPGDCLFLPQMWWHHVESLAEENVSLSIWFQGGALEQRPLPARLLRPVPSALALELVREWEFYLAAKIGYGAELVLFTAWLSCSSGAAARQAGLEPPAKLAARWFRCGTLILQHAVRLLPTALLHLFIGAFNSLRFQGLEGRSGAAAMPCTPFASCSLGGYVHRRVDSAGTQHGFSCRTRCSRARWPPAKGKMVHPG
eukprot:s2368_g6.t1